MGKRADLVLLESNPLDAVGAFRRIIGVMNGGRWITRAEIAERLEAAAAAADGDG